VQAAYRQPPHNGARNAHDDADADAHPHSDASGLQCASREQHDGVVIAGLGAGGNGRPDSDEGGRARCE
jgi:hypothetical protein